MSKSKKLISDESLLRAARRGRSNSAFDELLRRYTFYAKRLSSKCDVDTKATGIRKEEIEQVALISFYSAYKKIKLNSKSFYLYWETTAKRDIRIYFAQNSYLEGCSKYAGISFDEDKYENNDRLTFSDYIGESDESINRDILMQDLMHAINSDRASITDFERKILLLFLKGYPMQEIAKKLKKPSSTVYCSFQSAVKKLRLFIEK